MSNIIVAKRSSFVALRPRVPSFAAMLTNVGRLLRRKSRQEAQAKRLLTDSAVIAGPTQLSEKSPLECAKT